MAIDETASLLQRLYRDIHFIWPSPALVPRESGATACGQACLMPPPDAVVGADFRHNLALTTEPERVTCKGCLETFIVCQGCGEVMFRFPGGGISHSCSKVCTVCGHPACPFCGDWCDQLSGPEHDELCCDGECTYAEESGSDV